MVSARVEELRPGLAEAAPWTTEAAFSGTVNLYLHCLATALRGFDYLLEVVEEDGFAAVPPRLLQSVNAVTNTALRAGTLLGLDPTGKATVAALASTADVQQATLAGLAREGRKIRKRAEAAISSRGDASPGLASQTTEDLLDVGPIEQGPDDG
jgi:hypothetical protein